jgi:hypothetical protein
VTDGLENLLDLLQEAIVVNGGVELDDTEMTRAFSLIFFASGASKVSIDGT